jgi:hypothetical protein
VTEEKLKQLSGQSISLQNSNLYTPDAKDECYESLEKRLGYCGMDWSVPKHCEDSVLKAMKSHITYVGSQVIATVVIKSSIFCDIMS